MESSKTLRDLDRAAAAPFINYPPTPSWYPPFMGAYAATICAALALGKGGHKIIATVLVIAVVVAFGVVIGRSRSRSGTWPRISEAPDEIRQAYKWYAVALTVPFALSFLASLAGWPLLTVAVTFMAFTAFIWRYEKVVYPAAARRVRERLA